MSKKQIIYLNKGRKLVDELSLAVIIERLKKLFAKHIGRDEAIAMPSIHNAVYKKTTNNKWQYIVQCQRILGAMTLLRKKTYYFIVGEHDEYDGYVWYIVKTGAEAQTYKDMLNAKIKGMKIMREKVDVAVTKKFYKKL